MAVSPAAKLTPRKPMLCIYRPRSGCNAAFSASKRLSACLRPRSICSSGILVDSCL